MEIESNNMLKYGIDLGTTNSCIAILEEEEIRVFQTRENTNTSRSAVHITKTNRKIVGLRAYNALYNDPENVAIEFKRLMGTAHVKHFPAAGVSMTPEELSSEILKSMKQDVERLTNENVRTAVITVPAAFGTLQCESTYQAAKLAGIELVHLLQEPIAAAIAYGIKPEVKDKYWMIFDLGGGTFDVAIVSTHQGRLTVLNNEGNNYLGGKDIDNLIVENIFLPEINKLYALFPAGSVEQQMLLSKLQFKVEDLKIELSNLSNSVVYLDDVGCDAKNEEINIEIEVSQEDIESLMENILEETIKLSEKALNGANITKEDLTKIILVGGSTQIPAIRNKIRESFAVDLDYTLDPITAVARGAAIYASMISVGEKTKEQVLFKKHGVGVKMEYEPITANLFYTVAGVFYGDSDIHEIAIYSRDGFWESGWLLLKDHITNYFEVDIRLQNNKMNTFIVRARDKHGNNMDVEGGEFNIKHQESYLSISKPLLPHTLSIEYFDNVGHRKLEPIIRKNTSLPAFGFYAFKATKELRITQANDFISIKLWEGEEFAEPEANMWVANLYIRSQDISRPLAKGSEVEISLEVDESRRINIEANIPFLNLKIDTEKFYKPTPVDTEERFSNIKDEIDEFYQRLEYLDDKIPYSDEEKRKEYNAIHDELENLSIDYYEEQKSTRFDSDKTNKYIARSKGIRVRTANLERSVLVTKQHYQVEKDVVATVKRVNYTVENFSNSDDEKDSFEKLKSNLHEAIEFKDSRGVQHIKNKMDELERTILTKRFDYWQYLFHDICESDYKFTDRNEANKWISIGKKAEADEDLDSLKVAVVNLLRLLKKTIEQVIKESTLPPGLNK